MKAISDCIYTRGKHGFKYVRRRVPAAVRSAFPARQTHILRSPGTTDLRAAKEPARAELARIDAEPRLKGQRLDLSRASFAAKRASYVLLRAVITALDYQLARQRGDLVDTDAVAPEAEHPLYPVAPERAPGDPNAPTRNSKGLSE